MKTIDILKEKLNHAFSPSLLEVEDDSLRHAGHREAGNSTESHFNVILVASCFEGMPLVKRHQKVYTILDAEMKSTIHALSLKTLTPQEYAKK